MGDSENGAVKCIIVPYSVTLGITLYVADLAFTLPFF